MRGPNTIPALLAAGSLMFAGPGTAGKIESAKVAKVDSAASYIKSLINHHRPVRFDPYFDVTWSKPNSPNVGNRLKADYETVLPIVTIDHGVERYFRLTQTGKSLATVGVAEISQTSINDKVESLYDDYFNCGQVPSNHGVVYLNKEHHPVVNINYQNHSLQGPIGYTYRPTGNIQVGPPVRCH